MTPDETADALLTFLGETDVHAASLPSQLLAEVRILIEAWGLPIISVSAGIVMTIGYTSLRTTLLEAKEAAWLRAQGAPAEWIAEWV